MPAKNMWRIFLLTFLALQLTGCGPQRAPVPPGTIPQEKAVLAKDEAYGQEVLGELLNKYQLDHNDARINRIRDIVARLTEPGGRARNPWHTYVLNDSTVKNAAATRGNYVFVWTGMIDTVKDDDELATVLAHEIGHVLAGHTSPTPQEETSTMLAQVPGVIARESLGVLSGGNIYGPIAEILLGTAMQAFFINPEAQRKELEADQIGMFLMADSGIDPQKAVAFWQKAKNDPAFRGSPLQFLSTHPSSDDRVKQLQDLLPRAVARYREKISGRSFAVNRSKGTTTANSNSAFRRNDAPPSTNQKDRNNNSNRNPFVYR